MKFLKVSAERKPNSSLSQCLVLLRFVSPKIITRITEEKIQSVNKNFVELFNFSSSNFCWNGTKMPLKVGVAPKRKRERKQRVKKEKTNASIRRLAFLRLAEEEANSMYQPGRREPPPMPKRQQPLETQAKPPNPIEEQNTAQQKPSRLYPCGDFLGSKMETSKAPFDRELVPAVEPIAEPVLEPIEQTFSRLSEQRIEESLPETVSDICDSICAEFEDPASGCDANLVPPSPTMQTQGEMPDAHFQTQFDAMQPNNNHNSGQNQSLHDLLDSLCPSTPNFDHVPPMQPIKQSWDYLSSRPCNPASAPPMTQAFNQPWETESNMFEPTVVQSWNYSSDLHQTFRNTPRQPLSSCSSDHYFRGVPEVPSFKPPAGYQGWDYGNHLQHGAPPHSTMAPAVARDTPASWKSNFKIDFNNVEPPITNPMDTPRAENPINMTQARPSRNNPPELLPMPTTWVRPADNRIPLRKANQQDTGPPPPLSVPKPTTRVRPADKPYSDRSCETVQAITMKKPSDSWSSWLERELDLSSTKAPIKRVANPITVQKPFQSCNTTVLSNQSSDSGLVKIPKTHERPADNAIPIQTGSSVSKNQITNMSAPTLPMKPAAQSQKQPMAIPKPVEKQIERGRTLQAPITPPVTRLKPAKTPIQNCASGIKIQLENGAQIQIPQVLPVAPVIPPDKSMSRPKSYQRGPTAPVNPIDNGKTPHPTVPKAVIRVGPAQNRIPMAKCVSKTQKNNVAASTVPLKPGGQLVAVQKPPMAVQKQPMAVQKQPMAVQNQPMAVQKQPMAVQKQPMAVQKQPMAVQKQPMAVQKPSLNLNSGQVPIRTPITRVPPANTPGVMPKAAQISSSGIKMQQENGATIHIPQIPPTFTPAAIPAANPQHISRGQSLSMPPALCQAQGTFNGQQRPMITVIKGDHGEDIHVSFVTGPDGLITQVKRLPPNVVAGCFTGGLPQLEPITTNKVQQILQAPNSYTTLHGPVSGPVGLRGAMGPDHAVEDEEVDYEEIGVAETFAEYWPTKLKHGVAHPDAVVETATLSSVELPDITYDLSLPPHFQTSGSLSALQLEAVFYACQAHERILPSGERAGFLLGDGAGVGKGRAIAGIIYNNYLKGRKRALWISVSNDLKFDAERDLQDIGAGSRIKVRALNKLKYHRIDSEENGRFRKGVIFCTYTALIGESMTANSSYQARLRQLIQWLGHNYQGVIVFDECHKAKNLTTGNGGKSTKTGATVLELQQRLPLARVIYASATGASEPKNMAYMTRLGLWGPGTAYPELVDFVYAVEKRGIGAMELVAMDMKLRGTYIARQLSFKDVTFRIQEVNMQPSFTKIYNQAAELWAEIGKKFTKACQLMNVDSRVQKMITCQFWCAHQRFFRNMCIASKVDMVVKMTRHATRHGKAVVIGLQSTGETRTLEHLERNNGKLTSFVSTSKMIIQSFVEKHFPAPKREAFIELVATGEFVPEMRSQPPRPKKPRPTHIDWMEDSDGGSEDSDMESLQECWPPLPEEANVKAGGKRRGRPKKTDKVERLSIQDRILQHLHENMLFAKHLDVNEVPKDVPQQPKITERDVTRCILMKEQLLEKIEELGRHLPPNTLDKLISKLGGTSKVAEMTGRRGRVICESRTAFRYESRVEEDTSMDLVNYREKQRFMEGEKYVAIISEAASSGISLQSDKRVLNQRRRLHITLELPWSADRAIQQFGRTHRSNQVNSPEYVFVITNLAGERRFASTVAKRLESLGALTQGDRRATDARDLSQFNIDNAIGRNTLEHVMQQMAGERLLTLKHIPESYEGDFHDDCATALAGVGLLSMRKENNRKIFSVEKDCNNIAKFLNRILGCRVEIQNAIFKFFLGNMYSLITQMKRTGRFDLGILDLDAHGASVTSLKLMRFTRQHATGTAATELHTVKVERGMSFEQALAKFRREAKDPHEGFYILKQKRRNKNNAVLCLNGQMVNCLVNTRKESTPSPVFLQLFRPNTGPQVKTENLTSITQRYVKVPPEEAQMYWQHQYDTCLTKCSHSFWSRPCPNPTSCELGLRVRTYHVLSGLMLPIWGRIEKIIERNGRRIQIIRVKTDVNKKIVGTVVPPCVYNELVADLSSDSTVSTN
ncbi:protein strawberry notch [Drosophila miranda]|uniref:protein strawberry notch n=1 Tax=Drosophila miranda TaxID=7229 RepID=UPI0007E7C2D2|nr:protein strawberry notch [Drosophila miranda]